MTTFKGSLGYSSQTKRDKFISQYTDVQNDEMVKIFMGNKRGCLLQPLPCICLYICLCPIITGPPAFTTPAILRQRRYRTVWRGGVGERCRCVYKEPPSISTSLPPSLRCCGEEGSNYSGVSVAGCDSSPGKRRRASITHRPAMG